MSHWRGKRKPKTVANNTSKLLWKTHFIKGKKSANIMLFNYIQCIQFRVTC